MSREDAEVRKEKKKENSYRCNTATRGEKYANDVCIIRALYSLSVGFRS